MRTSLPPKIAVVALATLLVGCSQVGPILPRRTTLGSLKTSVSHLEFENEQLRSQMAKLQSENREIENRLVQEESANGELSARLNDAKYELSRRGLDLGDSRSSSSMRDGTSTDSTTTVPAGRSSRKRRKAPFARIPGMIDEAPASGAGGDEPTRSPRSGAADELGPQSLFDEGHWLPVARGTSAPSTKIR